MKPLNVKHFKYFIQLIIQVYELASFISTNVYKTRFLSSVSKSSIHAQINIINVKLYSIKYLRMIFTG